MRGSMRERGVSSVEGVSMISASNTREAQEEAAAFGDITAHREIIV